MPPPPYTDHQQGQASKGHEVLCPRLQPWDPLVTYIVPAGPTKVVRAIRSLKFTMIPQLSPRSHLSKLDPCGPSPALHISTTHTLAFKWRDLTVGGGMKSGAPLPTHKAPYLHTITSHPL